ncbi:MAG: hypothetical protein IJN40_01130 [Clostridia bacterium]|nr:hypothetical protein [Clostridia bacterium]
MVLKDFVNMKIASADKEASAEGLPLTLTNCKKYKKMRDLKVYGNSFQDGTPTPDNPIEVQSVGEKSVNLVKDVRESFKTFADYTELEEDGRQCIRIKSHGEASAIFDFAFKENTQYTISFDFKCKYDRSGVSLSYDTPIFIFYTDGNIDYLNVQPIDNTWRKRVYTTKANKTISHIQQRSFDYRVYTYIDINTFQIQEGATATPYEPYGKYKIPVVQRGINLFDISKFNATAQTINGITFTPLDDERVHIKGKLEDTTKSANYKANFKTQVFLKQGTYKTKINKYTGNGLTVIFNISNGTDGSNISSNISSGDITFDNAFIQFAQLYVSSGTTIEFDDIIELQLMKGTEDLPYEPYVEPVTANIFLNNPLRKLGDYADYIDYKENKVVRNIKGVVFKGGEVVATNKSYENTYGYTLYYTAFNKYPDVNMKYFEVYDGHPELSTHFIAEARLDSNKIQNGKWYVFRYAIFLVFNVGKYETVAQVNEWVASQYENGTPVIFYYLLAEPIEEPLICDLPKLNAKTTIIEVDTSLVPSSIYGKYIKK